jgi:hypothetical protein
MSAVEPTPDPFHRLASMRDALRLCLAVLEPLAQAAPPPRRKDEPPPPPTAAQVAYEAASRAIA